MRKLKQIAVVKSTIFAIAEDGTFWRTESDSMLTETLDLKWLKLDTPPEGDWKPKPTLEEIGEKLQKKGRQMILGRGLKP